MSLRAAPERWRRPLQPLRWLACVACFLCACVDDGATVPLSLLDRDVYAQHVQPYVADACATLDCHGVAERPLRLHSELGWRADDRLRPVALGDDVEPIPLTDEELDSNVWSFRALQPAHSADGERLVLTKPLARSGGGGKHVGGDLFETAQDAGYRCLHGWLTGEAGADIADACADARGVLGVE